MGSIDSCIAEMMDSYDVVGLWEDEARKSDIRPNLYLSTNTSHRRLKLSVRGTDGKEHGHSLIVQWMV